MPYMCSKIQKVTLTLLNYFIQNFKWLHYKVFLFPQKTRTDSHKNLHLLPFFSFLLQGNDSGRSSFTTLHEAQFGIHFRDPNSDLRKEIDWPRKKITASCLYWTLKASSYLFMQIRGRWEACESMQQESEINSLLTNIKWNTSTKGTEEKGMVALIGSQILTCGMHIIGYIYSLDGILLFATPDIREQHILLKLWK